MNKESIRNCYNKTFEYYKEQNKVLWCSKILTDLSYLKRKICFEKGEDVRDAFSNPKYQSKYVNYLDVLLNCVNLYGYNLIKDDMCSDFGVKSEYIDIDIKDKTYQFELLEFESFYLVITPYSFGKEIWDKYRVNEETLHDLVVEQHSFENDKDIYVSIHDLFSDTVIDLEEADSFIEHVRDPEINVNIFDLVELLYEEYRVESIKTNIVKYKKQLVDEGKAISSFECTYKDNKEEFCDLLINDVIANQYVNKHTMNLSYFNKGKQTLVQYGPYQLKLTENELRRIKNFFTYNKKCLDEVVNDFNNFINVQTGKGNDWSVKILPLLKMIEKTYEYILVHFWGEEGDNTISYGDIHSMDLAPLEKYRNSLFSTRPALVKQFGMRSSRYNQLKKVSEVYLVNWRNAFVHKDNLSMDSLEDVIVGSFVFLSLMILVYVNM